LKSHRTLSFSGIKANCIPSLSFKGIKANFIPVHYYNQKGAWMDRGFFKIGPTSIFSSNSDFPERERITTENSVAARQCPFSSKRVCANFQRWPQCCKVFASQHLIFYTGGIVSMKEHYWADLLRPLADQDYSIIALWKKFWCWMIYGMPWEWSSVNPVMLVQS
jgi:hypothetical protein